MIEAVRQTGDLKMPPKGNKLRESEISDLVAWVKSGANWDPHEVTKPVVATLTSAEAKGSAGDEFFETKIRPILSTECGSCHQAAASGGLSMLSRDAMVREGGSGPAITPGDPDHSLLLTAVHQTGTLRMPKNGKLSDQQISDLTDWVKMGAPWPASSGLMRTAGKQITAEMRAWWAFQPLKLPEILKSKNAAWAKNDVDRLMLAKLEAKDLAGGEHCVERSRESARVRGIAGLGQPGVALAFWHGHREHAGQLR